MQARLPIGTTATAEVEHQIEDAPRLAFTVAGLFAGIGGVEIGFREAGHHSVFMCEFDESAKAVLTARFPDIEIWSDVVDLERLPEADIVSAGFPCQDLSLAGRARGISAARSGLVWHIFRLLDAAGERPRWLLLENVPFLLQLQNGDGMRLLVDELEQRGFMWAYRVVDTRAFGLPQRRRRVLIAASTSEDPRGPLLGTDSNGPALQPADPNTPCGFYWTEGHRGIGWSQGWVPPIKVGSGLGIPSPPAIWFPATGRIAVPDIRDLERLQGFDADWTKPAEEAGRRNDRWRLVGNAVSVPVSRWLGERLSSPRAYNSSHDWPMAKVGAWPHAGWGAAGERYESSASMWPTSVQLPPLDAFLRYEGQDISPRAAAGLLSRLERFGAKVPIKFVDDLKRISGETSEAAAHSSERTPADAEWLGSSLDAPS